MTKEGIKQWSKLYDRTITADDYSEICQNLSGFFETLHKWDQNNSKMQEDLPWHPTEE